MKFLSFKNNLVAALVLGVFLSLPTPALGITVRNTNESVVENTVRVETKTGGNAGSSVATGTAKAHVQVETIVNGTPLASTNIKLEAVTSSQTIEKEFSSDEVSTKTKVEVSVEPPREQRSQSKLRDFFAVTWGRLAALLSLLF
jgi:hypothetical protein